MRRVKPELLQMFHLWAAKGCYSTVVRSRVLSESLSGKPMGLTVGRAWKENFVAFYFSLARMCWAICGCGGWLVLKVPVKVVRKRE